MDRPGSTWQALQGPATRGGARLSTARYASRSRTALCRVVAWQGKLGMRAPKTIRYVQRWCRFCGRAFSTTSPHATHCSKACYMRSWRAVGILAGTHGYVQGRFVRLP